MFLFLCIYVVLFCIMYLYDLQRKESKSGPGVAKNIYLLKVIKGSMKPNSYDVSYRFVVIANTEKEARKLAQSQGGGECDYEGDWNGNKPFWTEPKYTSIEVIGTTATYDDSVRVVANCFHAG